MNTNCEQFPFLLNFIVGRTGSNRKIGKYSMDMDIHVKNESGIRVPLVYCDDDILESKTITEIKHERED